MTLRNVGNSCVNLYYCTAWRVFFSSVFGKKKKKKLRSMIPSVNVLKGKFKQVQTNKILMLDCYGNLSEMGLGHVASNSVSNGLRYTVPTQRVFILSIHMKRGLTKPGVLKPWLHVRIYMDLKKYP